jgi:hypothetical protein
MELEIGRHLEETELEQYSMGRLPSERLEEFEEHFLACDACQDKLLEMEAYVNAMCSVSPKLRNARTSFWTDLFRWPRLSWVGAFGLSAVSVAAGVWILAPYGRVEVATVTLSTNRGAGGTAVAEAPSGKALTLNVDLTQLQPAAFYRMEVVGATGKLIWETIAEARDGKIVQPVAKALPVGQYYVRLYLPGGPLLREFSLKIGR